MAHVSQVVQSKSTTRLDAFHPPKKQAQVSHVITATKYTISKAQNSNQLATQLVVVYFFQLK